jgi:hypothetical protein
VQRISIAALTALAFSLAGASSVQAQYNPYGGTGRYGPYNRPPTLSPYLNLLNGGNTALNYYLQVQPAFERRAAAQQFESAIIDLERRTNAPSNEVEDLFPTLSQTGHPVGFMNFNPYYNSGGGVGRPTYRPRR